METFSALLVICARNSPVTGEFLSQMPVTRSFHVFFDLRLNRRLSKQSRGWWSETPSRSLWRHCNEFSAYINTWGAVTSEILPVIVVIAVWSAKFEFVNGLFYQRYLHRLYRVSPDHLSIQWCHEAKFEASEVYISIWETLANKICIS